MIITFSVDIPTVTSLLGGIPVEFTHNGKQYFGLFQHVQGAGGSAIYHLLVNNYYLGRLRQSAFNNKWVFDGEFADKAEWFSELVAQYQ